MFVPATSIDLSGKGGIDKLLGAVNPLLFSTGIVKVRWLLEGYAPD